MSKNQLTHTAGQSARLHPGCNSSAAADSWGSGVFGEVQSDGADCQWRVASVNGDTLLGRGFLNDTGKKRADKNVKSCSSPVTSRDPVLLAFPRSFSAKQVYLPSSARVTLRISRLPSSQINTLRRDSLEFLAGRREARAVCYGIFSAP